MAGSTQPHYALGGRVALVTGAGSGIGRAAALAFAGAGARVVVSDVSEESGAETVRLAVAAGGEAVFIRADVSRPDDVAALVQGTVEAYGRLDYAVNNAGITGAPHALADLPEEQWERTIAINLTGTYLCMKHEIPRMLAGGGGAIVNTASAAGLSGVPDAAAYSASKHGVIGLTRAAAREYARTGIRVNAICPGWIETPMIAPALQHVPGFAERVEALVPLGRTGTPAEVAAVILWLCSDAAAFVTGHALAVDGGLLA